MRVVTSSRGLSIRAELAANMRAFDISPRIVIYYSQVFVLAIDRCGIFLLLNISREIKVQPRERAKRRGER